MSVHPLAVLVGKQSAIESPTSIYQVSNLKSCVNIALNEIFKHCIHDRHGRPDTEDIRTRVILATFDDSRSVTTMGSFSVHDTAGVGLDEGHNLFEQRIHSDAIQSKIFRMKIEADNTPWIHISRCHLCERAWLEYAP